jgi:hypothetical protein
VLVVGTGDRVERGQRRSPAQHLLGEQGVYLKPVVLRPGQRSGLVQDGVRHAGQPDIVHPGSPAQQQRPVGVEAGVPCGVVDQIRAPPAESGHVRRLEVDEVGNHGQRIVEGLAGQQAAGGRLEIEHRIPGVQLGQPPQPPRPMGGEKAGQRGVVGAAAPVHDGGQGIGRGHPPRDRLHVMADVHHPHRQRDALPGHSTGNAQAVPPLEGAGQRLPNRTREPQPLRQQVSHLAASTKVGNRPLVDGRHHRPRDLPGALVRAGRAGQGDHIAGYLGRVCGIVHERSRTGRDLVTEVHRDLMRVAGAAEVAQQRGPVDGLFQPSVIPCLLSHPDGQQARAQLRLQRLAEGIVLGEGERRDEFTEPEHRYSRHVVPPDHRPGQSDGSREPVARHARTRYRLEQA